MEPMALRHIDCIRYKWLARQTLCNDHLPVGHRQFALSARGARQHAADAQAIYSFRFWL